MDCPRQILQHRDRGKCLAVQVETRPTRMTRSFPMAVAWWEEETAAQRQDR